MTIRPPFRAVLWFLALCFAGLGVSANAEPLAEQTRKIGTGTPMLKLKLERDARPKTVPGRCLAIDTNSEPQADPDPGGLPMWMPGEIFRDCPDCPEMVVIAAGSFWMGCVSGLDCGDDEKPVNEVRIGTSFALATHEVTFAQWDACVADGGCGGYLPSDEGWGRGSRPVVNVSWDDAQSYAAWLSRQTGESYRLPSEAEWEYAARAGTTTKYHFGNDENALCRYGNHADSSTNYGWRNAACSDGFGEKTAPAASLGANDFGLYDMHGNVWEWTEDCWNGSYEGAPSDGSAWLSGDCILRVLRGGSWVNVPSNLRGADRIRSNTGLRNDVYGFRVARTLRR